MRKRKYKGLVWEIVVSLSVLMIAALILIGAVAILMRQYQSEYQTFTPFVLILYIVLFAIVISASGYMILNRVVLKPLRALLEATERVSEGNLDFRVDIPGDKSPVTDNEITDLAMAFNRMTERIKQDQIALKEHVDDLKRVNQELERTQSQLIFSEKLAGIGQLAAGVAHEIGNPLSAIRGYLEILERKPELKPEELDMLRRVKNEVERIHRIIKDLLEYSRRRQDVKEEVDINREIEESLRLMETQKGFKGIELDLELENGLPPIEGNINEVKQLFINMILNAIDAMEGKGKLSLKTGLVRGEENQNGIEVRIKDTGGGISKDNLRRIFDPFFTTKDPGKGSGLGLSICQRIVESMSGTIEVESEPEKGTAFHIKFPLRGYKS